MNKKLFILILIGLFCFNSCKKAKETLLNYQISSLDSKNKVVVEGMMRFLDDPNTVKNAFEINDLVVSNSAITFSLMNELTYDLKFNLDNIAGTFNVSPQINNVSLSNASGFTQVSSGEITVSNLSVKPLDEYRGIVNFKISGEVVIDMVTSNRTLGFDFTTKFNNESDGPKKPPTDPKPPTGGGNTDNCLNTISILGAVSYYSYMNVGTVATESITNVKCIKTTADNGAIALVISGNYNRSTYPLKYQVQLVIPQQLLKANTELKFNVPQGVIGTLVSIDASGSPTDSWRTNRDYGKDKEMGLLKITAVTPKIQGTYQFKGSGDGYPSLNSQFAETKGSFCVDP